MSTLLQELNEFSLKITQAIDSEDWQQLIGILALRQARLLQLSNAQLSLEEQRVLESIQAMDKLFIETIQIKKTVLLKEFQMVAQGQKSVKAYYATATN
jgi:hypothetical protein